MRNFAPKPWLLPQPVIVIGTYNREGVPNAMNAAWAGTWDMKEVMISLGNHATTQNLNENGNFTIAFATVETMAAADFVGIASAKTTPRKIERTEWTAQRGEHVNAPVFIDFPMTFECRVKSKIDESASGCFVIAEIVNIVVDEQYLAEDGLPDVTKMDLITLDPVHHCYVRLGETVGEAYSIGKSLK